MQNPFSPLAHSHSLRTRPLMCIPACEHVSAEPLAYVYIIQRTPIFSHSSVNQCASVLTQSPFSPLSHAQSQCTLPPTCIPVRERVTAQPFAFYPFYIFSLPLPLDSPSQVYNSACACQHRALCTLSICHSLTLAFTLRIPLPLHSPSQSVYQCVCVSAQSLLHSHCHLPLECVAVR